MEVAAFVVSVIALIASSVASLLAFRSARQANANPVLVDLFKEHRQDDLASARIWVHDNLENCSDVETLGLEGVPKEWRDKVRDLAWFYDNLGVLVHHGTVDIEPVSGYLGGSVLDCWPKYKTLVLRERELRQIGGTADANRWQCYFELLYEAVKECPPASARRKGSSRRIYAFRT